VHFCALGNRVYKKSTASGSATERKYVVDITGELPVILMELNGSGGIVKTYVYANSEVIAQHDGDTSADKYFYLHDRLGSVRLVIDDQSAVKNTYTYEPFGEMFATECTETAENPFKFTGQYFDSEIEEYYLRARQYNPHLARFTSRDPVAGQFEQPLTLHRYLYCVNAPVNWIDPDGKWAIYVTATSTASMGHSVVGQFGFAFDDDRNFDDITIAGYGAGSPSVSEGISVGFAPFADTIYNLEGVGGGIGGSYRVGPVGVGVEAFVADKIGIGIEITVSASLLMPYIPGEIHGHATFTTVGGWSEAIADYIYEEKIYEAKTLGQGTAMLNLGAILDQ